VLTIVKNLWAVGAPPRTTLGEVTALPRPLAAGRGLLSLSKNPTRALGLRPFGLAYNEKYWARISHAVSGWGSRLGKECHSGSDWRLGDAGDGVTPSVTTSQWFVESGCQTSAVFGITCSE